MRIRPLLAAAGVLVGVAVGRPLQSPAEETQALEATRQAALRYVAMLPDFFCTQQVQRFHRSVPGDGFWQPIDGLSIQLTYFEQAEKYKVVAVDGARAELPIEAVGGAISTGEFGSLMALLFDPASKADFKPKGSTRFHGRNARVYAYRVARATSHYSLTYGLAKGKRTSIVGYHGLVYADRDTSMVVHLTVDTDDVPNDFEIRHASSVVDYGFVDVSGTAHVLPVYAESVVHYSGLETRNTVSFAGYRKFSADSRVEFQSPKP